MRSAMGRSLTGLFDALRGWWMGGGFARRIAAQCARTTARTCGVRNIASGDRSLQPSTHTPPSPIGHRPPPRHRAALSTQRCSRPAPPISTTRITTDHRTNRLPQNHRADRARPCWCVGAGGRWQSRGKLTQASGFFFSKLKTVFGCFRFTELAEIDAGRVRINTNGPYMETALGPPLRGSCRVPHFPLPRPFTVRSGEWPAWFSFWFSGCWRALAKGTA